jgi:hypothetical protein
LEQQLYTLGKEKQEATLAHVIGAEDSTSAKNTNMPALVVITPAVNDAET